jgi:hypothetical protein
MLTLGEVLLGLSAVEPSGIYGDKDGDPFLWSGDLQNFIEMTLDQAGRRAAA